jgi:hypothetical protein
MAGASSASFLTREIVVSVATIIESSCESLQRFENTA